MHTVSIPPDSPLPGDVRTNVCVIGAGIAGMTTAYLLARAGKAVTVIDSGPVGGGETGRTTAHITALLDDRYATIARRHGGDRARQAAESHTAAIERIEAIADLEDIDCDFERVNGYLFLGEHDDRDTLDKELYATHAAGLTTTRIVPHAPITGFDTGIALEITRQAQFHPLKYLKGLAKAIVRDGGTIACGTKAMHIEDGEPAVIRTADDHTILADDIVVATNSPVNDWMVMHSKQAPYRTYVVAFRIPKGAVPHVLLWDTSDPYHYVRVQAAEPGSADELLIVGGEDHKTGQSHDAEERFARLERWARRRFPMARELAFHWSGQVLEPVDGLAYIGKNPGNDQHIYIITGVSGNGMTYGTLGGMLITDLLLQRENPWTTLYDPSRINVRSATEYARENINVVEQYTHWLTPGDVGNVDDIEPGSGAVIRRGIHKIAAYKDDAGHVTECSAVCTHLYCIVDWNDMEKTWDCPCHGSRFDAYGKVISGPAIEDLPPAPVAKSDHVVKADDLTTAA